MLTVLLIQGAFSYYCPKYRCSSSVNELTNDSCIHYDPSDHEYILQSCGERNDGNTFCRAMLKPSPIDSVCQTPPSINRPKYPGEACQADFECNLEICSNGVCAGKAADEACTSQTDCNPGFRCRQQACKPLLKEGETGCSAFSDCETNLGCENGVCQKFFSVAVGDRVEDCHLGTSFMCYTGACHQQNVFDDEAVCIEAPQTINDINTPCETDDDCKATNVNKYEFQGECVCGNNPFGDSYCQGFIGDKPGYDYLYYTRMYFEQNYNSHCNTAKRFDIDCILSSDFEYKMQMIESSLRYNYFPQIQDNEHCTKEIYTSYYWEFAGAENLVISAFFIAILL